VIEEDQMAEKIYELREYTLAPGMVNTFIDRFANTVVGIFERYKIKVVLFLDPVSGPNNKCLFLLEWNSLAEREERWNAFKADPEWIAAAAASEENGPIVLHNNCTFMRGTPKVMARIS
jgi:hypothetical protein